MVDVTKNNFNQVFPDIIDAVDESDFIAIDTEFTGLRNGPGVTAYDTPPMYYDKIRTGSLDFLLVQLGLCAFRFDSKKNKYVYKAFNFNVFPRTIGRCGNDVNFLCQSSSISFLSNNGFDFNKLFREGIPYVNMRDAERLQEELAAKYENLSQAETVFSKVAIPDELSETVENVCSRMEKFLLPDDEENEITFDNCNNAFLRKLIHQTVRERFPSKHFCLFTKWVNNLPVIVAQKGKSNADVERENFEREKKELLEATRFSQLIRRISEKKKLIVGHNMILDICHIVNRFCWPLPESYLEFKDMVQTLFPRIIDTKYMCNAYPLRDLIPSSVVSHMLKRFRDPPFELKDAEAENPEFAYTMDCEKAHEAGYDAYVTGLAFIALTTYLGKKKGETSDPPSVELLKPFENKVNMMRVLDCTCFNFKAPESIPPRKHVFHITFPQDWKTSDILQLFNPYGEVHVSYINQISAWVTLHRQEEADAVIADLVKANLKELPAFRKPYTVITSRKYYEEKSTAANASASVSENVLSTPSLKDTSTLPTSHPAGVHSSPSVSQSSGDADPAIAEMKLPVKRSSAANGLPRKRKKDDSNSTSESVTKDVLKTDSGAPRVVKRAVDFLMNKLKRDNASVPKTFEEPPWE